MAITGRNSMIRAKTQEVNLCMQLEGSRNAGEARESLHPSFYVRLVKACTDSKDLTKGRHVHAQILQCVHCQDRILLNLLIEMYGKCGSLGEARNIFDSIEARNVFSWNIMITAYAQNGHLEEARTLFDKMPERDPTSWNSMITAYAQDGHLVEAWSLFGKMPGQDRVSWNTMIAAYAQHGHSKEAIRLFRFMALGGSKYNDITFVSAINACGNLAWLAEGRRIHGIITDNRLKCSVKVGTTLVNMYSKCGSLRDAKNMFDRMPEKDAIAWTSMIQAYTQHGDLQDARNIFDSMPQRPVDSWNTILAAYAQHGYVNKARMLFDKMPEKDVVSWTTMVGAYGQSSRVEEARSMFDKMPERNIISWNAMIAAYAQSWQNKEAIRLFCWMDLEGMQPNEVSVISIFDACANVTDLAEGKAIHESIVDEKFHSDVVVATSLIHMYGKCGSLKDARAIFDDMPQRNIVTWTAMVSAYAHNGHSNEALELFQTMGFEGFQANWVTFVSILSACSHAGLLHDGWQYFVAMVAEYGVLPKVGHYICMIDLLGRVGRLEAAEELIHSMPFCPDLVTWMTLLGACQTHKDVNRAEVAAEQIVKLDPDNSAPYILLSNMHTG